MELRLGWRAWLILSVSVLAAVVSIQILASKVNFDSYALKERKSFHNIVLIRELKRRNLLTLLIQTKSILSVLRMLSTILTKAPLLP